MEAAGIPAMGAEAGEHTRLPGRADHCTPGFDIADPGPDIAVLPDIAANTAAVLERDIEAAAPAEDTAADFVLDNWAPDGPEPNRQGLLPEPRPRFRLPERLRRCYLPAQDFRLLLPHPPLACRHFCGNRPSS
jgi:hypothetical protein